MTHKDAPPITDDQRVFESWWSERLAKQSITVDFRRGKKGNYLSEFARDAWDAWQAAKVTK